MVEVNVCVCFIVLLLLCNARKIKTELQHDFKFSPATDGNGSENGSLEYCSGQSECSSPWSYCDNEICKCGKVPDNILQCSLKENLTVINCNCATFDRSEGIMEAGMCMYNCGRTQESEVSTTHTFPGNVSELNDYLCSPFNRSGTLCGSCKEGYYPLAYSFDMNCVECPHGKANWWKYLLVAYFPLTIFYFFVLFFKINVTSSHFHGFVHYSQAITLPALSRILLMTSRNIPRINRSMRFVAPFYGVWNLDFLRTIKDFSTCLQVDILGTICLDLAIGIYPLLLMVLTYILIHAYDKKYRVLIVIWKPFHRALGLLDKTWTMKTSLIDAFATFFLLSNIKFLSVSADLLAPVKVYELDSTGHLSYSWKLYLDASIPYFGEKHLPYAILAFLVLTTFVLLPIVLLLVYPHHLFQKFLNLFPFRWYVLHTFMDAFQGCYKDGTQPGTRDCRWFAAAFIITRVLVLQLGIFTPNVVFFPFAAMAMVLLSLLIVIIQPFKHNLEYHSTVNAIFTLLLALLFTTYLGNEIADEHSPTLSMLYLGIAVLIAIAPLVYISVIVLNWLHKHRMFGIALVKGFTAWRRGYSTL